MMTITDWYYTCMYLLMLAGFCAFIGGLYFLIWSFITIVCKVLGIYEDKEKEDE